MKFDALPPAGFEWQLGKTAASIRFVNEAQRHLEQVDDPIVQTRLRKMIDDLKNGVVSLTQWTTVDEFLAF